MKKLDWKTLVGVLLIFLASLSSCNEKDINNNINEETKILKIDDEKTSVKEIISASVAEDFFNKNKVLEDIELDNKRIDNILALSKGEKSALNNLDSFYLRQIIQYYINQTEEDYGKLSDEDIATMIVGYNLNGIISQNLNFKVNDTCYWFYIESNQKFNRIGLTVENDDFGFTMEQRVDYEESSNQFNVKENFGYDIPYINKSDTSIRLSSEYIIIADNIINNNFVTYDNINKLKISQLGETYLNKTQKDDFATRICNSIVNSDSTSDFLEKNGDIITEIFEQDYVKPKQQIN